VKASPNNIESDLRPKTAGLSRKVFSIIKFILGICLLPFVYSTSVAFFNEFGLIETNLQKYFWAGVVGFLIIYLFVWEPAKIYAQGQKILEVIFRFFAPLVRVAPYLLPIYFLLIFAAYSIISVITKSTELINPTLFLFGFNLTLHLVFSAKTLRSKQEDFLKANYIFGFSFIYIVNLIILAAFMGLLFIDFSFINFCNNSFQSAQSILYAVFKQLFLR
jgi:hypothetical protein